MCGSNINNSHSSTYSVSSLSPNFKRSQHGNFANGACFSAHLIIHCDTTAITRNCFGLQKPNNEEKNPGKSFKLTME